MNAKILLALLTLLIGPAISLAQEVAADAPAPETAASAEAPATEQEASSNDEPPCGEASEEDYQAVQGVWERTLKQGLFGSQRIVKEIDGDSETVTYYNADGTVNYANRVKVTLYRFGPIGVFKYSDWVYVAGPSAGEEEEIEGYYIYKVVDDGQTFVEINGVLGDQNSAISDIRWTKASEEEE